jgi:hypothetical protein
VKIAARAEIAEGRRPLKPQAPNFEPAKGFRSHPI